MGTIYSQDTKGGPTMPVSEANKRAVAKYVKANYEDVRIRVPKGRKEELLAYAEAAGQSLNGYVIQSVDERIERDKRGKN